MDISPKNPVLVWWSGGVRSAAVGKICTELFPLDCLRFIFIDTKNEDDDTYRFKSECEVWYNKPIETICSNEYDNIEDIWYDHLSLGLAKGAICSSELKIKVRQQFIKRNKFSFNAFGYDIGEIGRAKDMKENNPHLNPIFPLLVKGMDKFDCVKYVQKHNTIFHPLELPRAYQLGLENNNCFKTGCVQGGGRLLAMDA